MTVYTVCFYDIYEGTYAPDAIFSTKEKGEEYIKTLSPGNRKYMGQDGKLNVQ